MKIQTRNFKRNIVGMEKETGVEMKISHPCTCTSPIFVRLICLFGLGFQKWPEKSEDTRTSNPCIQTLVLVFSIRSLLVRCVVCLSWVNVTGNIKLCYVKEKLDVMIFICFSQFLFLRTDKGSQAQVQCSNYVFSYPFFNND